MKNKRNFVLLLVGALSAWFAVSYTKHQERERALQSANPLEPVFSQLVVDLDGDGVELVALLNSSTYFDLNLDGFAENTGWVAVDDALLALDVNGDGIINSNSELFDQQINGVIGSLNLAAYDSTSDGLIDANDLEFSELIIWQDANGDGLSTDSEMRSLSDVGIASINLTFVDADETNTGHSVLRRATVIFADGRVHNIDAVQFETDLRASVYVLPEGFEYHEDAFKLPALFGYGQIASTWVRHSDDPALRGQAEGLLALIAAGDLTAYFEAFDEYLFAWAGVETVDPNGRNSNGVYATIDARELAFLERSYGEGYFQSGSADPNRNAIKGLNVQFDELRNKLAMRFLAQAAISSALLSSSSQEEFDTALAEHEFSYLVDLVANYSPSSRQLQGDLMTALTEIPSYVESGQADLRTAYNMLIGLEIEANPDWTLQQASEVVEATGTPAGIILAQALLERAGGINVVFRDYGARQVLGGALTADIYFHSDGDGSYNLYDWNTMSDSDSFTFLDLTPEDVSFLHNSSNDLIITTTSGDVIQIFRHFHESGGFTVEEISFADGTTLSAQGIRERTSADMQVISAPLEREE